MSCWTSHRHQCHVQGAVEVPRKNREQWMTDRRLQLLAVFGPVVATAASWRVLATVAHAGQRATGAPRRPSHAYRRRCSWNQRHRHWHRPNVDPPWSPAGVQQAFCPRVHQYQRGALTEMRGEVDTTTRCHRMVVHAQPAHSSRNTPHGHGDFAPRFGQLLARRVENSPGL